LKTGLEISRVFKYEGDGAVYDEAVVFDLETVWQSLNLTFIEAFDG